MLLSLYMEFMPWKCDGVPLLFLLLFLVPYPYILLLLKGENVPCVLISMVNPRA